MRWRRLRLEAFVRRLPSPSPPVQWRGEQLCAGQRAGWTAVRLRRFRLEASIRRLASHRRLGSGVARQLCAARRGSCVPTPPSARGLRPSPLVSSPSGHQHDGAAVRWTAARLAAARWTAARARRRAAMCWHHLSTRGGRLSPLVSVAACTAARRAAVRWTAARPSSGAPAPTLDLRRPSVASHLCRRLSSERRREAAMCWRHLSTRGGRLSPPVSVAAGTAARRAAARWSGAARRRCARLAIRRGPLPRLLRPVRVCDFVRVCGPCKRPPRPAELAQPLRMRTARVALPAQPSPIIYLLTLSSPALSLYTLC